MAVSGKTSDFGIPYLEESDLPDMGAGDKAIAERVNAILKSIKGDATLATDGTLTVPGVQTGGVAATFYSAAELTRASATYGSFSTPVKVELSRVTASQLIEVVFWGYYGGSTLGELPFIQLVAGLAAAPAIEGAASATEYQPITTTVSGLAKGAAVSKATAEAVTSGTNSVVIPASKLLLKHKAVEDKPLVIEAQGKVSNGTAKLIGAYLNARAIG